MSVSPVAPPAIAPVVQLSRVSKSFGDVKAVNNVSFEIQRGEFFSMLGPSGCGKTTTLRLLAGFEEPDEDGGEVRLLGEVVNKKRPYERSIAMVFQNYALFPHLSVERNVAFGLEQRNTPKNEIADRVRRALEMVRLKPDLFSRRMPGQLSGGQRQRVALARALVLEPAILLLDEPLGAIDLKLRKEMQLELKALNKQLGTTFVYVTHDQEEALTMSDRIAVMDNARVAQLGTPAEIYENPRTAFVAKFIGESNFFDGQADRASRTGSGSSPATAAGTSACRTTPPLREGKAVRIAVRPEWMDVCRPDAVPTGENALSGTIRDVIYLGETMHVHRDRAGSGRRHRRGAQRGPADQAAALEARRHRGRGLAAGGLPDPGGGVVRAVRERAAGLAAPPTRGDRLEPARARRTLAARVLPGADPHHARLQLDAARDLRRRRARLHPGALPAVLRPAVPRHPAAHLRLVHRLHGDLPAAGLSGGLRHRARRALEELCCCSSSCCRSGPASWSARSP